MTTKSSTENDAVRAATDGGPGWRPRRRAHGDELGDHWRQCGVSWEIDPLREVILAAPSEALATVSDPNAQLLIEPVDLSRMRAQAQALRRFFTEQGIVAHWYDPAQPSPPNLIFMRDLFLMTPEGAVVSRMAAEQRAGEERLATQALAQLGIPILATVRGRGTFEGADALWLDPESVLIGVGQRTNVEGAGQAAAVLGAMGVRVRTIPLPSGVQHLLGIANLIDRDLVALRADRASDELRGILREHGYRGLELPPSEAIRRRRAMNFVTLAPRRLVMPAGSPDIRQRYEDAGVTVSEVEVGEYLKAAGGLGCLTGIVQRRPD